MQLQDIRYFLHKVGDTLIPFEISDEAEKVGDSTIKYYGWLSANGAWIICENNTTNGTYRYVAGKSLYAANWIAREGQTYVLFSQITLGE